MNAYNALGSAVQALSEWTPPPLPAERETESVGRAAYLEAFDRLRAAERELEQGNGSEEDLLAAVQEAREAFWTVKNRAGVLVWGWEPSDTFEPVDYAGSPLERAEREMERALRETQKYAVYSWESPYRDPSLRRRGWYYPERRWNAERIAQHKAVAQAALRWSLAARDWRDALIAGASDKETAEAEERMDGLRAQWDAARQSPKFLKPRLDWEKREEIRCADEVLKNAYRSVDAHMISTNMFLWDAEKVEQLDQPPKEKRAEFRADMEKLAYYLHHLCAAKLWRSTLTTSTPATTPSASLKARRASLDSWTAPSRTTSGGIWNCTASRTTASTGSNRWSRSWRQFNRRRKTLPPRQVGRLKRAASSTLAIRIWDVLPAPAREE